MTRVRTFGLVPSWRSWLITAAALAAGLLWLTAPLLWPTRAATAAQHNLEAPLMAGLIAVAVVLLWLSLWRDAGRDHHPIGLMLALTGANVLLRPVLNAGSGIEVNYVLPLVAGIAGGGPIGFAVGAAAGLVSQFSLDLAGAPLAGQVTVWGLAGLLGGLLRRLGPVAAWLAALPLAVALGPLVGVLLNLIGWPTITPEDTPHYFFPGLPTEVNTERLLRYSWQTSRGLDLARGLTTAVGVALVGLPLIRALRQAWAPDVGAAATRTTTSAGPTPASIRRRDRARELVERWSHSAPSAPPVMPAQAAAGATSTTPDTSTIPATPDTPATSRTPDPEGAPDGHQPR